MLVDYSDSDEEEEETGGAAPAPAPAPVAVPAPAPAPATVALPPPQQQKPQRKQINLGQLLQRNDQELPFDVSEKVSSSARPALTQSRVLRVLGLVAHTHLSRSQLPAGFFDTAVEPDAGEPEDADVPAVKGWAALSALLPAPKVASKPSSGASLYNRAQKLGAPKAPKKTAVPALQVDPNAPAPPPPAAAAVAAPPPRAGPSSSSLRPRIDTSMYASSEPPTSAAGAAEPPAAMSTTYDVAPGPQLPDMAAEQFAAAAEMAGVDASKVVSISQDTLKRSIRPANEYAIAPKDAEEVKVTAKFFNRSTGGIETSYQPSKLQKRKHQINSLAAECAANSVELAQRRSAGFKTKQETQAKYGW